MGWLLELGKTIWNVTLAIVPDAVEIGCKALLAVKDAGTI